MTIEEEELLDAYIERVAELEALLEAKELQDWYDHLNNIQFGEF